MSTRKGRGVLSLTALTEKRKEESGEAAGTLPPNMRVFHNYEQGNINALHQRICEIIFTEIPEGETGIINVEKWRRDENVTTKSFRTAIKYLNILGYIEILPPTRQKEIKGTTIRVIKAYDIPPPAEKAMEIYKNLRKMRHVADGEQIKISLVELSVLTGMNPKSLKLNIKRLDLRKYIRIVKIDEKAWTMTFYFTNHMPLLKPQPEKRGDTEDKKHIIRGGNDNDE
jgi:hypothetical protein